MRLTRWLASIALIAGPVALLTRPVPAEPPETTAVSLAEPKPPRKKPASKKGAAAEGAHSRIVTLPVPKGVVREVGGLALRPDGKLLACTRRGDVWLVSNPGAADPADVKFSRFASGLHEPLGLHV